MKYCRVADVLPVKAEATVCLQMMDLPIYSSRMVEADGIILGSPVYSADVSAKMKAFLERGGVVVLPIRDFFATRLAPRSPRVRRGGGMTTVDTMNHFMLNKEMIVVSSTYWNMVYGKNIGDVLNDEEGMANMRNLGENMSFVLKKSYYECKGRVAAVY